MATSIFKEISLGGTLGVTFIGVCVSSMCVQCFETYRLYVAHHLSQQALRRDVPTDVYLLSLGESEERWLAIVESGTFDCLSVR